MAHGSTEWLWLQWRNQAAEIVDCEFQFRIIKNLQQDNANLAKLLEAHHLEPGCEVSQQKQYYDHKIQTLETEVALLTKKVRVSKKEETEDNNKEEERVTVCREAKKVEAENQALKDHLRQIEGAWRDITSENQALKDRISQIKDEWRDTRSKNQVLKDRLGRHDAKKIVSEKIVSENQNLRAYLAQIETRREAELEKLHRGCRTGRVYCIPSDNIYLRVSFSRICVPVCFSSLCPFQARSLSSNKRSAMFLGSSIVVSTAPSNTTKVVVSCPFSTSIREATETRSWLEFVGGDAVESLGWVGVPVIN